MRLALAILMLPATALAARTSCPPDAVRVGPTCVDIYEESVWRVPAGSERLVKKIQAGKVTRADLDAAGATQMSAMPDGTCLDVSYGPGFPQNGNWTEPLYAVSLPGVRPSTCISWFQAQQACQLSGKRLVTNAEWQGAAQGTPDPGINDDQTRTCATQTDLGTTTGARASCVSNTGARDMVGNVWEWTADWAPFAKACANWPADMGDDFSCFGPDAGGVTPVGGPPRARRRGGARAIKAGIRRIEETSIVIGLPSGIIRGGNFALGTRAGVFAVYSGIPLATRSRSTGFRCAR